MLLDKLRISPYGAQLGNSMIAALGFANDVVLMSDNNQRMQNLLDMTTLGNCKRASS